jgi:hypothetical protein
MRYAIVGSAALIITGSIYILTSAKAHGVKLHHNQHNQSRSVARIQKTLFGSLAGSYSFGFGNRFWSKISFIG